MPLITIAVCTYNRSNELDRCLAALASQDAYADQFDVIIVDNASTDDTKAVVAKWSEINTCFTYSFEPKPGLARARNHALTQTTSEFIAFTDDDAEPASNWISNILRRFATLQFTTAVLAGEIEPVWGCPPPEWLTMNMKRALSATLEWSQEARLLRSDEWPCEVNSTYRTEVLRHYKGFPESLGRQGDLLLSGENFVNEAMAKDGYSVFFDPEVRVKHYIQKSRLTKEWFRRRFFWQGVTTGLLNEIREQYNIPKEYWKQVHPPQSPRDWVETMDDDYEDFEKTCSKLSDLGYLLSLSNVIVGR